MERGRLWINASDKGINPQTEKNNSAQTEEKDERRKEMERSADTTRKERRSIAVMKFQGRKKEQNLSAGGEAGFASQSDLPIRLGKKISIILMD